jgi:NAD(P)-dependent dehydrogenase (short-subunit alcohol dehydrogenase family)
LVTGASRGIGLAIADRLRQEGVRVLTPDRSCLDLSSSTSMDAYLSTLNERIDILVNDAGINKLSSGQEVTDADLYETLQVNLAAPLRLIRALSPRMVENNYGRIVNISSIWSVVSKQRRVTYSMSKAGLNALTRSLAVELAPHNVLVNAVAPGFVNTELTSQNNSPEEIEAINRLIPMGRLAEPAEIAELVFFLCSEKNSYITGQTLLVDGGFTSL